MNMNASTEGQLRSRRKAAKMLVCVVVMFAICFLPVHLLSVLRLTVKLTNSELNQAFSLISHWLCYANSAVNPIIYNFMSGKSSACPLIPSHVFSHRTKRFAIVKRLVKDGGFKVFKLKA
ncbi:unnamed protein product [Brassicogethes aeneus]|uniref:G-protein coupled receptors family 1 profile domain-containing protein n=1 Tax=Brassicogethes aeneus TaxID=1431903 RepID=A0A9P0B0J1_BRAAE|nr:unnamed protein product [Brassicogethes aeneus]